MCVCVYVCAWSCLLSMIEDETQSEIGEKDRPAEGGQYNLKKGVQMCVRVWV